MIMAPKQTFEKAFKQLEQIVTDLETGDLALEKSLKKFEEGVNLTRFCTAKLDEIEKKITVLLRDTSDNIIEEPFRRNE